MMRREMEAKRLHRHNDPHTSVLSAQRALVFKDSHESRIFGVLTCCPNGATYRAIADALGMEPVAVGRRLKGMEMAGTITRRRDEVTGEYRARDNMALWFRC